MGADSASALADHPTDAAFWRVLSRVLGRTVAPGRYDRADLPSWDSLRHVELVFELEETFGLSIAPDDIARLYADTDTVRAYVRQHAARTG